MQNETHKTKQKRNETKQDRSKKERRSKNKINLQQAVKHTKQNKIETGQNPTITYVCLWLWLHIRL
jgi:hypothetical protein